MDSPAPQQAIFARPVPLFVAVITLLTGCICGTVFGISISPGDEAEPTPEGQAMAPAETAALVRSPSPTSTRSPTASATRTATSTSTATSTPLPPATQTALAIAGSRTSLAETAAANATVAAQAATSTRQALNAQRTQVARATAARATEIARYTQIDYRELINYADAHIGELVWVRGRVFNINSTEEFQMYFAGTYEALYVTTEDPFSGLYENDVITVYGVVGGETCGTNAFGAEICQPLLIEAFFVK